MPMFSPLHPAHVPTGLSPERLLRWCRARTQLDQHRAERKGKPIPVKSLERLLQRRRAIAATIAA